MRYFGAHVSVEGGLVNAISAATKLSINTIQIHPSTPQRWITKDIDTAGIESMVKGQKNSPVKKLFAHAIYLINLAQPDKQKFHLAKLALVHYLNFMKDIETIATAFNSDLQAGGVVVHVGTAIHYPSKQDALERILKGINWVLSEAPKGRLLLESSAGAGQVIGSHLADLAWLREKADQPERIGFTLDTAHMFASGYDWTHVDTVIHQIEQELPLNKVELLHLNDSKVPCGSRKDRHENLAEGLIGEVALRQIVSHQKLSHIPLVLETPRMKNLTEAAIDIDKLRSWITSPQS